MKTILVADDSLAIRKVLVRALRSGIDCNLAEVADFETLKQSARSGPRVDLIILSASLPGLGSSAALRELGRAAPPVLLIHGAFDRIDQREWAEAGVQVFLKKPFKGDDLSQALSSLSNFRQIQAGQVGRREEVGAKLADGFAMPLPHQVEEPFRIPSGQDTFSDEHQMSPTRGDAGWSDGHLWAAEAPAAFRKAVEDYCHTHFKKIATEVLKEELDRLTREKSRLQADI